MLWAAQIVAETTTNTAKEEKRRSVYMRNPLSVIHPASGGVRSTPEPARPPRAGARREIHARRTQALRQIVTSNGLNSVLLSGYGYGLVRGLILLRQFA